MLLEDHSLANHNKAEKMQMETLQEQKIKEEIFLYFSRLGYREYKTGSKAQQKTQSKNKRKTKQSVGTKPTRVFQLKIENTAFIPRGRHPQA